MADKRAERKLTRNPLGHGFARVDFLSPSTHHFEETFDCIRYTLDRFQTFTYNPINCDCGKCELQTIRVTVSIPRGLPEQKKILTLAAATKASFHEHLANVAFAHSLKSGVGVGELKVA